MLTFMFHWSINEFKIKKYMEVKYKYISFYTTDVHLISLKYANRQFCNLIISAKHILRSL